MKKLYAGVYSLGDLCRIFMKERVAMQITRIFLLLAVIAMLSGCASWRDKEGIKAPDSVKNICDNKCGVYENNQGTYTYDLCFKDCMDSKGYSKY